MEVQPLDLTPIVMSGANSLNTIGAHSLLGAITVLSLLIAAVVLTILIRQAIRCSTSTKISLDENTSMIREFKESNKESMHGIQMILAKIETRLER